MRIIKALIFYYLAEENSTLSYQTGWPEVFRKSDLFELFNNIITNFLHVEKNKNLDEKM